MSLGRDFRWLWSGNAAGNMADGIAFVAIPSVATTLTRHPTVIAGLSLVYSDLRMLLVALSLAFAVGVGSSSTTPGVGRDGWNQAPGHVG